MALQNVQNSNRWIAIKNAQTVGTVSDVIMMSLLYPTYQGTGGPFTHLRVHNSGEQLYGV